MGNCLAGDTCVFSHDPSHLVNRLNMDGTGTPPQKAQGNLLIQDYNAFPSLQPGTPEQLASLSGGLNIPTVAPSGLKPFHPSNENRRSRSRPGSRHQAKEAP